MEEKNVYDFKIPLIYFSDRIAILNELFAVGILKFIKLHTRHFIFLFLSSTKRDDSYNSCYTRIIKIFAVLSVFRIIFLQEAHGTSIGFEPIN